MIKLEIDLEDVILIVAGGKMHLCKAHKLWLGKLETAAKTYGMVNVIVHKTSYPQKVLDATVNINNTIATMNTNIAMPQCLFQSTTTLQMWATRTLQMWAIITG